MFNAVGIEAAFGNFFGLTRCDLIDADMFRRGNPKHLGELLEAFSMGLARRIEFLEFVPDEALPGGPQARLEANIEAFASMAKRLKRRRQEEPEDYHWEIIGSLVVCIAALLDHLEGKPAPP